MSKESLINSFEVNINASIMRSYTLEDKNKKALKSKFKEFVDAIECGDRNHDVLFVKKIS